MPPSSETPAPDGGDQNIVLENALELNGMITQLSRSARRSILVRSPRLEFPAFNSETFADQIRRLIALDSNSQVRFLVGQPELFLRMNTRLIALCRQFSTFVKARAIPAEYLEPAEMFVVVDDIACLHQPRSDVMRGIANQNTPGRARSLTRLFNEIWERSTPPSELFTLGLGR